MCVRQFFSSSSSSVINIVWTTLLLIQWWETIYFLFMNEWKDRERRRKKKVQMRTNICMYVHIRFFFFQHSFRAEEREKNVVCILTEQIPMLNPDRYRYSTVGIEVLIRPMILFRRCPLHPLFLTLEQAHYRTTSIVVVMISLEANVFFSYFTHRMRARVCVYWQSALTWSTTLSPSLLSRTPWGVSHSDLIFEENWPDRFLSRFDTHVDKEKSSIQWRRVYHHVVYAISFSSSFFLPFIFFPPSLVFFLFHLIILQWCQ